MNVYEKLLKARLMIQEKGLKQNGKNEFAKFTYFELEDILPVCNKICEEIKVVCIVSFSDTNAFLNFIDCEKPEDKITFCSPMSKANLKGCHEVQNLGAVQTYIKRYLYQHCFEIAESDQVDGATTTQPQNPQGQGYQAPPQQQQRQYQAPPPQQQYYR